MLRVGVWARLRAMGRSVTFHRQDVARDIRELSRVTGMSLTDSVADAVRAALAEVDPARALDARTPSEPPSK